MNPETPAPGPLPTNQPLPSLEGAGKATAATKPSRGVLKKHLQAAAAYLGLTLLICLAAGLFDGDLSGAALVVYWGGLGIHAVVAMVLMVISVVHADWRMLGEHVVAVLIVAAFGGVACWVNMMTISAVGGINW